MPHRNVKGNFSEVATFKKNLGAVEVAGQVGRIECACWEGRAFLKEINETVS